ncbi:hypothetical protein AB0L82_32565 [Nocardia sp. NPDC052001]|uniref:hypothetical protein n=1 Tax=Nocardia sp. NPDC052001 TaxID=3154853 RepID=UPI003419B0D8
MTLTRESTRLRTAGIVADGAFKVLLGAGALLGAAPLGDLLGVPVWLLIVAGIALMGGGAVEIRYVTKRPARTFTPLMVAYDSGWALTAIAGLVLAWQGSSASGEIWVGYQVIAPIAFAALLISATSGPDRAAEPLAGHR